MTKINRPASSSRSSFNGRDLMLQFSPETWSVAMRGTTPRDGTRGSGISGRSHLSTRTKRTCTFRAITTRKLTSIEMRSPISTFSLISVWLRRDLQTSMGQPTMSRLSTITQKPRSYSIFGLSTRWVTIAKESQGGDASTPVKSPGTVKKARN